VSAVAKTLQVARSNLHRRPSLRASRTEGPADELLLARIRALASERGSYGYRRVTALIKRELSAEGKPAANHKRVYRLMRAHQLLLQRHTGKPPRTHDGKIITLKSDLRWCSDGFEIRCWSGERVHVAFSLDCCDREVICYVAQADYLTGSNIRDLTAQTVEKRFGAQRYRTPHAVEWLSDNGPIYTAYETREFGRSLGLLVCTTPAYSPQSNGMAEAFIKSFKRDYVYLNRLETVESVLKQVAEWFEDYNERAPHRALRMRSPREFRRANSTC